MELDEFLEKDIIHFLEERKEKKNSMNVDREEDYGLYLTKDYLKEVTNALEKDEISIAQKLFDELKIHYDSLPKGSLEEKKIYSMLEQIYSKINSYLQLKGNSGAIKSFNDTLGQGFQGALSTKIHLTTTKMDKKLDNIDIKLTGFGKDMNDLKTTLSIPNLHAIKQANSKTRDSKISEEMKTISDNNTVSINNPKIQTNVFQELKMHSDRTSDRIPDRTSERRMMSEPSAVFLSTPKIQIMAPDSPKNSRGPSTIDREKRIFSIPKEIEKQDFEDITVFEEHKSIPPQPPQEIRSLPSINIHRPNIAQSNTQIQQAPITPHTAKEEPKKRMKIFKIPKKVTTKRHELTIMTELEPTQEKTREKIIPEKNIIEKNSVTNDEFEIMRVKTEKRITPSTPIENKSLPLQKNTNENTNENTNDSFDSPFQKPITEKPAENVIFSSIQTPLKMPSNDSSTYLNTSPNTVPNTSSSMSLNSFEGLYSEALKELNLKNYEGASKLFMKVLEMKPTHKASIIRLKQCEEAMHNA